MKKLNMHTKDMAEANIEKIGRLFPNCLTERLNENGKPEMAIDFDKLKQELSKEIVEGNQERYQFTWPGKREAMRLANTPTNMTLRPCRDDSVDFDNTENLYIEGDNLEVLKLLRENYLGKVKMIYIDPPYNTGNDFVYEDDFSQTAGEFKDKSGMFDESGNMLLDKYSVNSESNGRFHTDWLNMMYPRLKVARDLLSEDGILVVSISDAEFDNLKKVLDEIFGQHNYLGDILWNSTKSVTNTALISVSHTYNLVYFKKMQYFIENRNVFRLPDDGEGFSNPDNDPRGPWKADPFQVGGWRPNQQYDIVNPKTGAVYKPNSGCSWKNDFNVFQKLIADNRIVFGVTGDAGPQRKRFMFEAQERGKVAKTWWDDVETTTNGTQYLKKLFDGFCPFDNPKPIGFVKRLLELGTHNNNTIIDFFSGSATTAHAVMQLNSEDGGKRKFILVQLPEKTDASSEAYKAGYKTICEIGEERIRRAGTQIKNQMQSEIDLLSLQLEKMLTAKPSATAALFSQAEQQEMLSKALQQEAQPIKDKLDELLYKLLKLDTGFRLLKLDTSNMEDVYYKPEDFSELQLFEDNVKPDRTPEDLLFQVMLECNLPLSAKIEKKTIAGKEIFNVNEGYLIACFDEDVNEQVITEVAKQQPYYFIMRDKSLSSDNVADNFEQIFNAYSKDTIRKIL